MNRINDEGPEFPLPVEDLQCRSQFESGYWGMTLRDYFAVRFAAAMMTATSSDHDYPNIDYQREVGGPTIAERVAATAYRMADAMLKAREASND